MASQPYSVRFMSGRGSHRSETFTVPDQRRAVVRSVRLFGFTAQPTQVDVRVHGIPVVDWIAPGAYTSLSLDCRLTAYERETIAVYVWGAEVTYALDGFLFVDSGGEPDDAGNVIEELNLARPLPSHLTLG